jgi:hypothetical protein
MPLKSFQVKPQTHGVVSDTNTSKNIQKQHHYEDKDLKHKNITKPNQNEFNYNSVLMAISGSNISNDSEWVLFSPFDENAKGYEYDNNYNNEKQNSNNHDIKTDSVLSTRLSSYSSKFTRLSNGYIISDFDASFISDEENNNYNDDDNDDNDNAVEFVDSVDGEEVSLMEEVRKGINSFNESKLDELRSKNQFELISKINEWKFNVGSSNSVENSQITYTETESLKTPPNQTSKTERYKQKEKRIKALRKVVGKLYSALQKESIIDHEGVFMNNPDLDSCIPGYWKRIMLDNLMQFTSDHNSILGIQVVKDDITSSNRNFWEIDESGSVPSVSTGWENSVFGFH